MGPVPASRAAPAAERHTAAAETRAGRPPLRPCGSERSHASPLWVTSGGAPEDARTRKGRLQGDGAVAEGERRADIPS